MNPVLRKAGKAIRILSSRDPLWFRAMRMGVAAAVEHLPVLQQLGKVNTVIDIGANRGQFALVARHVFPQARILSFEPLHEPAAAFEKIFAHDSGISLHNVAIGPKNGETRIHVSFSDDSSSLLPITSMQDELFPGTAEERTETIRIAKLAELVAQQDIVAPALLKLDVQGYELEALQGCEALLDLFDHTYIECSFVELYRGQSFADQVIAWLREKGLVLSGVYNMTYGPHSVAVQGDFLFGRGR